MVHHELKYGRPLSTVDWQTCCDSPWSIIILACVIRNMYICFEISSNKHPNPRCNFLFNRPAYNHDHPRFFKIGQCLLTLLRHKFQQVSAGTKLRPQPFKSHSRIDMPGPPRSGFLTIPQVQSEGREHTQNTRQKQWQMMIWDDIGVSKLGTPNGNGSSTWSQIIRTPQFWDTPHIKQCFPCQPTSWMLPMFQF